MNGVCVPSYGKSSKKKSAPEDCFSGMKCGTPAISFNFRCEMPELKRIIRYSEQCGYNVDSILPWQKPILHLHVSRFWVTQFTIKFHSETWLPWLAQSAPVRDAWMQASAKTNLGYARKCNSTNLPETKITLQNRPGPQSKFIFQPCMVYLPTFTYAFTINNHQM